MITPRASSSPVEIFVPALNEFAHGFGGERRQEALRARSAQREVAQERAQRFRGRPGRDRLVRGVREDDEAVPAARLGELAQRCADPRVRVGGDARGEIEHDDPVRALRQDGRLAHLRVSPEQHRGDRQRDEHDGRRRAHERRCGARAEAGCARRRTESRAGHRTLTVSLDLVDERLEAGRRRLRASPREPRGRRREAPAAVRVEGEHACEQRERPATVVRAARGRGARELERARERRPEARALEQQPAASRDLAHHERERAEHEQRGGERERRGERSRVPGGTRPRAARSAAATAAGRSRARPARRARRRRRAASCGCT